MSDLDCWVCEKPIEVEDHHVRVCDHEGDCGCLPVPVHPECCPECCPECRPLAEVIDLAERRAASC